MRRSLLPPGVTEKRFHWVDEEEPDEFYIIPRMDRRDTDYDRRHHQRGKPRAYRHERRVAIRRVRYVGRRQGE